MEKMIKYFDSKRKRSKSNVNSEEINKTGSVSKGCNRLGEHRNIWRDTSKIFYEQREGRKEKEARILANKMVEALNCTSMLQRSHSRLKNIMQHNIAGSPCVLIPQKNKGADYCTRNQSRSSFAGLPNWNAHSSWAPN